MSEEIPGKSNNNLIRRKSLGLSRRTRLGQGIIRPNQSSSNASSVSDSSYANVSLQNISTSCTSALNKSDNSKNTEPRTPKSVYKHGHDVIDDTFSSPLTCKLQSQRESLNQDTQEEVQTSSLVNRTLSTPMNSHRPRGMLTSGRKKLKTGFKSPVQAATKSDGMTRKIYSGADSDEGVAALRDESLKLAQEIQALRDEGITEAELQEHMKKMHEYNELKDMGQMLLGKIALTEGVTTKDLYGRFGLGLDD